MVDYQLTEENIKQALDQLAAGDRQLAAAIERVGYPAERRRGHGYPTLMRIIIGQQLSIKAAATIAARVEAAVGEDYRPEAILEMDDDALRALGLSKQKVRYARGLSEAYVSGALRVEDWPTMDDEAVLKDITALMGFGRWSAEMYLMFSLGRMDIWPADDLAVQEAVKRLKGLDVRPKQKEMDEHGEAWRPYRSAMAIFLWHYYAKTPAI